MHTCTNKEFKHSYHRRHFGCQLSLVLRRQFDFEQCCLSCYLSIESISDILDMASYNRDKVILSVTIVSIEIVKNICRSQFYSASEHFLIAYRVTTQPVRSWENEVPNKRRDSHRGVKNSEAGVQSGKEQRSPNPTRPDPTRPKLPSFFLSTATIVPCTISLRFTKLKPLKGQ